MTMFEERFEEKLSNIYNRLIKIDMGLTNIEKQINKCGDMCDGLSDEAEKQLSSSDKRKFKKSYKNQSVEVGTV